MKQNISRLRRLGYASFISPPDVSHQATDIESVPDFLILHVFTLTAKRTVQLNTEKKQLYSVKEIFDQIDTKFIKFYGEYGRKIVNTRRAEWNQDGLASFIFTERQFA